MALHVGTTPLLGIARSDAHTSRKRDCESDRSVVIPLGRFKPTPRPHLGTSAERRQNTCTDHTYASYQIRTQRAPAGAHA